MWSDGVWIDCLHSLSNQLGCMYFELYDCDLMVMEQLHLRTTVYIHSGIVFQDMRNLRFAHKPENHSRRVVYEKLIVSVDIKRKKGLHSCSGFELCCCSCDS